MHNRAISLLLSRTSLTAPVTSPTTFSLALQAAASRAWSRRASTFVPTTNGARANERFSDTHISTATTNEPLASSGTASCSIPSSSSALIHNLRLDKVPPDGSSRHTQTDPSDPLPSPSHATDDPTVSNGKQDKSGATHTKQYVCHKDSGATPTRRQTPLTSGLAKVPYTLDQSGRPLRPPSPRLGRGTDIEPLPQPSTFNALCGNLVHLICHTKPTPALPRIIDYHDAFPELHSTHSYNLLLSLALHHTAYSIYRSLLFRMRTAFIPRNLETRMLEIRYLVHTGSWDQAWAKAQLREEEYLRHNQPPHTEDEQPIPLPIWLELFGMPRKGFTIQSERRRDGDENDSSPSDTPRMSRQDMSIWNRRLKLLLDNAPEGLADFHSVKPYAIRAVVWCLLRLEHREDALSITEAYFRSLPPTLSVRDSTVCTDIVNLHISFGSIDKGLAKLKATQTILRSLLDLNPSLRPDSNTLFLLLSPLHHAKWCGSKAKSVVNAFCAEWGDDLVDHRVKRRVVTLALKEGRHDIAEKFSVPPEKIVGHTGASSERTSDRETGMLPPRSRLFEGIGRARYQWRRTHSRVKSVGRSTDDTLK